MKNIQKKFFQLLRFSIGASSRLPEIEPQEWEEIYEIAKKQALLGIVFDGIEKMGNAVKMDPDLLMTWVGKCKLIERRNLQLNEAVVKVLKYFKKNGFEACILKGQGNALMYPKPLHRTPGDIDVWMSGKDSDVIRFVHSIAPDEKASYHHIDFPAYKGIPIEVHYRPCYLQNLICNMRLQRFFGECAEEQFLHRVDGAFGSFALPTSHFNVVYQLVHVFGHLFQEGIGLRQIVDYYFVVDGFWKAKEFFVLDSLQKKLKRLGLFQFAGAMMYVLHEVLGLTEDKMIVPMDEKRGRMLLEEILVSGNFGRYDERYSFGHGAIGHNLQRLFRDLRLVRYYPAEALSEPIFRVWHFLWRMWNKKW